MTKANRVSDAHGATTRVKVEKTTDKTSPLHRGRWIEGQSAFTFSFPFFFFCFFGGPLERKGSCVFGHWNM